MHLLDGDVGASVFLDLSSAELDHFGERGAGGLDAGGQEEGYALEKFLPLLAG